MVAAQVVRAHVVVGGFPPGAPAGHDMDYARLRLLGLMSEHSHARATVASDYDRLGTWLQGASLLVSYAAGPFPAGLDLDALDAWLDAGGRWLALHGTSGGKAAPVDGNRRVRTMVKMAHHRTLGGFFLNHPPLRRFEVIVHQDGPLTAGVSPRFETEDELYLVELTDPEHTQVLLTTELDADPSPAGFGFVYDEDTSAGPDGRTRVLGYRRDVGAGAVTYLALGHCHGPSSNSQPFVDASVTADGTTPLVFRGSWETEDFVRLLRNALAWGLEPRG
ncbi:MAG: ThuA domain-containing protein [Acidimicrobiia bacterium]|nr:ThuA domain-containing protein [Acidimicrobiia bacterium]